jgi:hypothetical protein
VGVGEAVDRALMGRLVEEGDEAIAVESVKRATEVGVESIVEVVKEGFPFPDCDDRAIVQRLRDLVEEGNKDVVASIAKLLCVVRGTLDDVVGIARMLDEIDGTQFWDWAWMTLEFIVIDAPTTVAADPRQTVAWAERMLRLSATAKKEEPLMIKYYQITNETRKQASKQREVGKDRQGEQGKSV